MPLLKLDIMKTIIFIILFSVFWLLFGLFLKHFIYRKELDAQEIRTSAVYFLLIIAVIYAIFEQFTNSK